MRTPTFAIPIRLRLSFPQSLRLRPAPLTDTDKMRFALATVLAAAGLVAARPPCYHTKPPTCHLDGRDGGHHTIEVPAAKAAVGSPFSFKFSDTVSPPPLPFLDNASD